MSSSSSSSAPLLRPRHPSTQTLASLLTRVTSRNAGPSVLVRQTAARHLESRRAEWGYSAPVVALDITWNLAFFVTSLAILFCSLNEHPNVPVRVWIAGYAAQCLVHVGSVWGEYSKRRGRGVAGSENSEDGSGDEEEDEEEVGAFGIPSGSR